MKRSQAQWFSLAALLCTTLIATALLLVRGPSCGHDFDFHLVSWLEVARAWRGGLFYPHWAESANFGAGEPRFIFYPPASWLLGGALGALFGWKTAPCLFTAICLFCAGLSMRRLAREWLALPAATAGACLYIANPYMLFVAYERTAYGELMAAILIPLLLFFAIRPRPPIAPLAATIASIWLMNAPSGVLACYTLLWIALLRLASARKWYAPLRMAAGTAIGLALAGFYLVPAAHQEHWVEIARAIGPEMRFQDSFLFHRTGEPFHDMVLQTASIIACILLAFAINGVALSRESMHQRPFFWLVSLLPLILFLLVPMSTPLWRYAPRLAYVQFPWRWLLIAAPVAALFVAGSLAERTRTIGLVATASIICLASIVICTRPFHQYCDEEDNIAAQVALSHEGGGQEGTDEYTPRDDDNAAIYQDMPEARVLTAPTVEEPDSGKEQNPEWQANPATERPVNVQIQHWGAEQFRIVLDSSAPGFAVLRLMDYPAWIIRRDGVVLTQRPRRDDGLVTIPVPQGRSQIDIRWHTTPDIWVGRIVSLSGLFILGWIWFRERSVML